MNILITNDDGISAEGIAVLARAAKAFGDVTVVAPTAQCSAMSHRITLTRPLTMQKTDFPVPGVEAYSLDGTPADCVKAALDTGVVKLDVVLSGINNGYNAGYEIVYSGTVAAAMEALMNGIPAIALSRHHIGSFAVTERYLGQVLGELLSAPALTREIWNVNFPTGECRGILRDRIPAAAGYYEEGFEVHREGSAMILEYPPAEEIDRSELKGGPDSDLYAVKQGYISVGKVACPVL